MNCKSGAGTLLSLMLSTVTSDGAYSSFLDFCETSFHYMLLYKTAYLRVRMMNRRDASTEPISKGHSAHVNPWIQVIDDES